MIDHMITRKVTTLHLSWLFTSIEEQIGELMFYQIAEVLEFISQHILKGHILQEFINYTRT